MRIVVLDKKACQPERCGFLCAKVCPLNRMGEKVIVSSTFPEIDEEKCTGCGICVKRCPFSALKVVNLPEERGPLLHSYGKNAFRLYGLPTPGRGITALIGANSLGKSTLVKILAGKLRPSGGPFPPFFQKWLGRRTSYKPQDLSPLRVNLPVSKLLERFGVKESLVKRFGLEPLSSRPASVLSGGELQRLALAISLSKEADLYLLDEASNYLDIRERFKLQGILPSPTILVEHDLGLIDLLADQAYILYGVPGAYGIFSSIKAASTGINEFLAGYLRSENVRIREEALRLTPPSPQTSGERLPYPAFSLNLGDFHLEVAGGWLPKGEVLGILGPNGIGKTTFLSALAKELDLRVSMKPQYLEANSLTVAEFLSDSDRKDVLQRGLSVFGLAGYLHLSTKTLSLGKLQALHILRALGKEADVYLLDEPSAFLDVEARLSLLEFLRFALRDREKSAVVVDHDLLFLQSVAAWGILFTGEPGRRGKAGTAKEMPEVLNSFMAEMGLTARRDAETGRPRFNKPGSVKDREQRASGQWWAS